MTNYNEYGCFYDYEDEEPVDDGYSYIVVRGTIWRVPRPHNDFIVVDGKICRRDEATVEPDDDRIVVIDGVEYIEVNGKLYNVDDLIDEGKLHRIDENGELRRDEATVEFEDGVDYVCVDGIWKTPSISITTKTSTMKTSTMATSTVASNHNAVELRLHRFFKATAKQQPQRFVRATLRNDRFVGIYGVGFAMERSVATL
jgi:hypothetical protein